MCKLPSLLLFLTFTILSVFSTASGAQEPVQTFTTEHGKVRVEKVIGGLDTPWAMAMLPNGRLLVTERDGKLLLVDPAKPGQKLVVTGLPEVQAIGQGGLLDVVLDPDFKANKILYFTYSDSGFFYGAGTAIARAKLETAPSPRLTGFTRLYSMSGKTTSRIHFGSRIVPDFKGNLFFTIGDRGEGHRAQDPFDPAGSVIRIRTDGSIPEDNPFADGDDGLPEIWSIGHRNPQGATLNDKTGELWTLAHGAQGGDEINISQRGKNYGWPIISYGRHYSGEKIGVGASAPGMEQPIYYWDPSIAPSGFDFYQGDLIPRWKGNLFAGALKFETLVRLEVVDGKIVHEERLFGEVFGRVRDVRSFPDGALWFLTDDSDGAVYRVTAAD